MCSRGSTFHLSQRGEVDPPKHVVRGRIGWGAVRAQSPHPKLLALLAPNFGLPAWGRRFAGDVAQFASNSNIRERCPTHRVAGSEAGYGEKTQKKPRKDCFRGFAA